jgi:hypothetical protein
VRRSPYLLVAVRGVVDQNIEPAESFDRGGHDCVDLTFVPNVRWNVQAAAQLFVVLSSGWTVEPGASAGDDRCARSEKGSSDAQADTLTASGDDDNVPGHRLHLNHAPCLVVREVRRRPRAGRPDD